MIDLSHSDPRKHLIIKGAQVHNLKNVDLVLPQKKLIVITGLSGSGKTSIAFDTIYAEGQRRYVESLSAYARQFMDRINKPKVDYIKGLAPTIAVEQRAPRGNKRSTVGTKTEIYDYLKLLYARVGKTFSPKTGQVIKSQTVTDVLDYIKTLSLGEKLAIMTRIDADSKKIAKQKIAYLINQGYVRSFYQNQIIKLSELYKQLDSKKCNFSIVIERTILKNQKDYYHRLADSISSAFELGNGYCQVLNFSNLEIKDFSKHFESEGKRYTKPSVHFFSFNNRLGSCPECNGLGEAYCISPDVIIPDKTRSLIDGAIEPWETSDDHSLFYDMLINNGKEAGIRVDVPYNQLSEKEIDLVWNCRDKFIGINPYFEELKKQSYDISYRRTLSRYSENTTCSLCKGSRLNQETNYVKIGGKSLSELLLLPIDQLRDFISSLTLSEYDKKIANRLLIEITNRLSYLEDVGLGYLTLNRPFNSLSGGEAQRIQLATGLGSSLVGSIYVLDEPSVGLHAQDTKKLISILKSLRDLGNTVIVVEHDQDIILSADHIVDVGPEAGTLGGEIIASGSLKSILKSKGLTASYLNGSAQIHRNSQIRNPKEFITIKGAQGNNLKNIDVGFPLNCFTVICGVSGSGKSTLVKQTLFPKIQQILDWSPVEPLEFQSIEGPIGSLDSIEYVDQKILNRSSRSNPATYIDVWKDLRQLYAQQPISKLMNYPSSNFSFNVEGGRCEECEGDGYLTIEMQFMADIHLKCEHCHGTRYKKEIRQVTFNELSIDQILELTVDDAISFFTKNNQLKISKKLKPLQDVGMGYVNLGQSSNSLSGGEAQRLKLASFISQTYGRKRNLMVFDEPSVGLHFHDLKKLIRSFELLIERGNSIIVIDHNIDLIKCADYLIELGPGGGHKGGQVLFQGPYDQIFKQKQSIIRPYLTQHLNGHPG